MQRYTYMCAHNNDSLARAVYTAIFSGYNVDTVPTANGVDVAVDLIVQVTRLFNVNQSNNALRRFPLSRRTVPASRRMCYSHRSGVTHVYASII